MEFLRWTNIYHSPRLSIDTLRSAHHAVQVRTFIEEVTNTCLLYLNSFSLSSVASSIASNIPLIWIFSFCQMAWSTFRQPEDLHRTLLHKAELPTLCTLCLSIPEHQGEQLLLLEAIIQHCQYLLGIFTVLTYPKNYTLYSLWLNFLTLDF